MAQIPFKRISQKYAVIAAIAMITPGYRIAHRGNQMDWRKVGSN